MAKRQIDDWEQKLIDEAEAISRMGKMQGHPHARGKRIAGARLNYKKTSVATVGNRDKAALHVGFAPDRTHG